MTGCVLVNSESSRLLTAEDVRTTGFGNSSKSLKVLTLLPGEDVRAGDSSKSLKVLIADSKREDTRRDGEPGDESLEPRRAGEPEEDAEARRPGELDSDALDPRRRRGEFPAL